LRGSPTFRQTITVENVNCIISKREIEIGIAGFPKDFLAILDIGNSRFDEVDVLPIAVVRLQMPPNLRKVEPVDLAKQVIVRG
jgi:hypothetical protein